MLFDLLHFGPPVRNAGGLALPGGARVKLVIYYLTNIIEIVPKLLDRPVKTCIKNALRRHFK